MSKFAALDKVKKPVQPELEPVAATKTGRKAGKSSNADFQQVSILLHRDTRYQVGNILSRMKHEDTGTIDLSELTDMLLRNWISEHA
jgi:hypothetical protein